MSAKFISVAMFLKLITRWTIDTLMSMSTTVSAKDDKCIVVPLEDSVRLTPDKTIYRGEFFASEESTSSSEPLVVLFPVALARVRLVSFDLVVDCHEGSDLENV